MKWLSRWLRVKVIRAELRDIEENRQRALDYLATAWIEEASRLREIEDIENGILD